MLRHSLNCVDDKSNSVFCGIYFVKVIVFASFLTFPLLHTCRLSFKPSTPSAEDKESQSSLDRLPAGPESPPSVSDSFQSFSSLESGGSSASQAQISQDPRLVIASSESTMSVDDSENDRLSFADALSRDADAVSRDAATRVTCKPRAAQQPSSSREVKRKVCFALK